MNSFGGMLGHALVLVALAAPVFAGNDSNYRYLALGDSVAFGYDPTVTNPAPAKYTGYPEIVADFALKLKQEVNAACPGQSSTSFLFGGQDIGCEPFKAAIGLHTAYTGTQVNFAVSQLQSNKHIELVTLSIGGNDLSLLELQCSTAPSFPDCVGAALPGVLGTYAANLTQILTAIRAQGGYQGKLILVKYYAPNADPLFIQVVGALNQVMTQVATPFGAKFADGFTAFQIASALSQGDPCQAGLLIRLSPTTCDIHPTRLGQQLLAATVLLALHSR